VTTRLCYQSDPTMNSNCCCFCCCCCCRHVCLVFSHLLSVIARISSIENINSNKIRTNCITLSSLKNSFCNLFVDSLLTRMRTKKTNHNEIHHRNRRLQLNNIKDVLSLFQVASVYTTNRSYLNMLLLINKTWKR
jgi:hypothetical protein